MKLNQFQTIILAGIMLFILSACTSSPDRTESANNTKNLTLPKTKLGHAAVNDGTYIYVLGGSNKQFLGDIDIIDPQSNTIKTLKNKIIPRRYHSAVFDGKESIFIIGGVSFRAGKLQTVPVVEVFNIRTEQVSRVQNLKAPTRVNTAVIDAGKIYVMGGTYPTRQGSKLTAAMFVYDIADNSWSRLADMPTAKSTRAAIKNGFIYVMGGYNNDDSMAVFERYDINNNQWESLPSLPKAISANSLSMVGNKLYSFGNYDYLDDTFVYDFDTELWSQIDIGYLPSRHNAATTVNGTTYVLGGTVRRDKGSLDLVQIFTLD